jgi:hypothetical protein
MKDLLLILSHCGRKCSDVHLVVNAQCESEIEITRVTPVPTQVDQEQHKASLAYNALVLAKAWSKTTGVIKSGHCNERAVTEQTMP